MRPDAFVILAGKSLTAVTVSITGLIFLETVAAITTMTRFVHKVVIAKETNVTPFAVRLHAAV
jgi:hypothetical protein